MTEPSLTYKAKENALVVHLPKELGHHNCRSLKYKTDLLLPENYIAKIVFDFSVTDFMDSSGIGVILSRCRQMEASGGEVSIYGAGVQILRMSSIGDISKLVPRHDTEEAAIAG